jgi:hypothetical protein
MSGSRIDAQDRPIDGAMLLDIIETMAVDFDTTSNIPPTNKFLTHPDMMPSYRAAIQEIENDPKLQSRQRAINAEQHSNWIDREDRRKLVD